MRDTFSPQGEKGDAGDGCRGPLNLFRRLQYRRMRLTSLP